MPAHRAGVTWAERPWQDPAGCDIETGGRYGVHELGIAQSIVDSVRDEAAAHGGGRVTRIGLRIGELSGVNADALRFSFQISVQDTEFDRAELEIEEVPLTARCSSCHAEFRVVNFDTACPTCGSSDTRTTRGDELQIVFLEME